MKERLGQFLRQLRKERGLTLAQVAALTGINLMAIQRAEKGKRDMRLDELERLGKVYGLKASTIVRRIA